MLKGIGRDVRVVAISVITSALVVGVPATAAVIATNSDKVDGKHAVGAKADAATRAGKLVATNKFGQFPNDVIAKALDADLLDGLDSTAFLGATETATDAEMLDGLDSSAFLGAGGTAVDSERLDGLDSTDFLGAGGKATDSDLLDGKNSTEFLGAGGTAVNAERLDGMNSTDFLGITGKATDADKLDGIDSSGLMRGPGLSKAFSVTVAAGTNYQNFVTNGESSGARGTWFFACPADTNTAAYLYYYNFGSSPTQVYVSRHGSDGTWFQDLPANGGNVFIRDAAAVGMGDLFTWTFSTPDKNLLVTAQVTARRTASGCTFTSQAIQTPQS